MAFAVSYDLVGMIMMVPHGAEAKHGVPIHFLASLSLINATFLISGRPRIVAAVNHVMKLIVAAAFDRGNTVYSCLGIPKSLL